MREMPMFGGVSFMINDKMVVAARDGGDLLVRSDPKRSGELLAVTGATPAEMGVGRTMGSGWITVANDALASDEQLSFWIDLALDYNTPAHRRKRSPTSGVST